jgi:hypothetical protein
MGFEFWVMSFQDFVYKILKTHNPKLITQNSKPKTHVCTKIKTPNRPKMG